MSTALSMHEHHAELARDRASLEFWLYLMTDLLMFATLFATYVALRDATAGGPTAAELFSLPNALTMTMLLLVSSFTSGLAMLAVHAGKRAQSLVWFVVTFALGAAFLAFEMREFAEFIREGDGPQRSAFLSAFFVLTGSHGVHIASGLLWMAVAMWQMRAKGLTTFVVSKLERLAMFWHFLDVVWIFIFTTVYLMARLY